jgi:hypothetical protein
LVLVVCDKLHDQFHSWVDYIGNGTQVHSLFGALDQMRKKSPVEVRMEQYPQSLVRIADDRVRRFLLHFRLIDFDLRKLIISAYCQGVVDTADALAQTNTILTVQPFIDEGLGI